MKQIEEDRITKVDGKFIATCTCGKVSTFAAKNSALNMLRRGNCRYCKRDYRSVKDDDVGIYQNASGQWCSKCSGCGIEQAYTRKDHAKQSEINDWQCKPCVAKAKAYADNRPVGDKTRVYRKFKKAAADRRIKFELTEEQFYADYNGICKLTGWSIDITYANQTASVDRIDNDKGYEVGNIQWVHSMVNMSRGKRDLKDFIEMCAAVAQQASVAD